MKTKLLFTKKQFYTLFALLAFCLCFNNGWAQELVKNGTCDEHGTGSDTSNTSDNADAWDMTPNSTLNGGITSPYRYDADDNPNGWRNQALEDWLEDQYDFTDDFDGSDAVGQDVDEQPGSTSSGRDGTRGVKLYDDEDGDPVVTESTRRLYQRVVGLVIGENYTFSIDSRSESVGTPSEVYILNTEIADEIGINTNGYSDSSVVYGEDITTDNPDWITTTFAFTATTTEVVIYVRALGAASESTEVFYDNISLKLTSALSTKNVLASNFKIFPNPAKDILTINSNNINVSSLAVFDLLGKKVFSQKGLNNPELNIAHIKSGLYVLEINTDKGSLTKKIVVQ